MNPSLSVILPVCNAESKLAPMVHNLLEVASDLTSNLDLVIVDDGSTDSTEEVATDLGRQFPQVKTVRYAKQAGQQAAVRVGLSRTKGDIVLIQNIDAPVSGEAIRDLWKIRIEEELVFTRSESTRAGRVPVMHSQPTWSGGTQMLRRDAIEHQYDEPEPNAESVGTRPPRMTRTDKATNGEKSSAPIFQQFSTIEMQPDR